MELQPPNTIKEKTKPKFITNAYRLVQIPIVKETFEAEDVYVYYFPKLLAGMIDSVENKRSYQNLRSVELNAVIAFYFSDVFYMNAISKYTIDKPWILSKRPLSLDLLDLMVEHWIDIYYKGKITYQTSFKVKEEVLNLNFSFTTFKNQTGHIEAHPSLGNDYNAFVSYFLHELSGEEFQLPNGEARSFVFSHGTGSPRLVSWKPHGEKGYWSYVLDVSVQSIPNDPTLYLYIHPRMLKHSDSVFTKRKDSKTSPMFRLPKEYVVGNGLPNFVQLQKVWLTQKWPLYFAEFLKRMGLLHLLPDIETFKSSPNAYLQNQNYCNITIPHGNHITRKHPVESGLSPIERFDLSYWLKDRLVSLWSGFGRDFPLKEMSKTVRLATIKREHIQLHDGMVINLLYTSDSWRKEIRRTIEERWNLTLDNNNDVYLQNGLDSQQIGIQIKEINAFELLGENPYSIEENDESIESFRKKIELNFLELQTKYDVVFVELNDKDAFINMYDPKKLIRNLLAKKGYVSQFVVPIRSQVENPVHRFNHAVDDLLRQFGFSLIDINKIPNGTCLVGLHIEKYKKYSLPILTVMYENKVLTNIPTVTEGWVSYHKAQLLLAKHPVKTLFKYINVPEETFRSLRDLRRVFNIQHTILFGVAQNISKTIPWSQNKRVGGESVILGEGITLDSSQISFVRLRTEDADQAPEWIPYGYDANKTDGSELYDLPSCLQSKLLKCTDNVFMSIAKKPDSVDKTANPNNTKFDRETAYYRKESALEIFVPIYHEKIMKPSELAKLAHRLRYGAIQYEHYLEVPLPVHFSKLICEYIFY